MPARARRRAIQPGRRTAIAVNVGEDLVDLDMATYMSPPITSTVRLHSVNASDILRNLPTLYCENETGHDRALSVPRASPDRQSCDQSEFEAFRKRSGRLSGITKSAD